MQRIDEETKKFDSKPNFADEDEDDDSNDNDDSDGDDDFSEE